MIALKYFLNKGLSDKLKQAFSDIPFVIVKSRPLVQAPKIFNPYWIAGFTSGDGCFYISIYKSSTKLAEAVRLMFTITQHSRDELLMKNLVNYLACGRYLARNNAEDGELLVMELSLYLINIILVESKPKII